MADARETAVRVLMAVDRGAWSDLKIDAAIRKAGLDSRDAAFCTAICAGVLQNRALLVIRLQHILRCVSIKFRLLS